MFNTAQDIRKGREKKVNKNYLLSELKCFLRDLGMEEQEG
jgi:hypothetical protein